MARIYAEKLFQNIDYRQALIESKEKWKTTDIKERHAIKSELASQHAIEQQVQFIWDQKKAHLERNHHLTVVKVEKEGALLLELFKSGRSQEDIASLMSLIDTINP